MKKEFRLNLTDTQSYQPEIKKMMNEILPLVVDFFKQYDATVDGFVYDSTYEFGTKAKVLFGVTAPGMYSSFSFEILPLERAFRSPKDRFFRGSFVLRGASAENVNFIKTEFNLPALTIVDNEKTGNPTPKEKILDLFKQTQELRDKWKHSCLVSDIFVF